MTVSTSGRMVLGSEGEGVVERQTVPWRESDSSKYHSLLLSFSPKLSIGQSHPRAGGPRQSLGANCPENLQAKTRECELLPNI